MAYSRQRRALASSPSTTTPAVEDRPTAAQLALEGLQQQAIADMPENADIFNESGLMSEANEEEKEDRQRQLDADSAPFLAAVPTGITGYRRPVPLR